MIGIVPHGGDLYLVDQNGNRINPAREDGNLSTLATRTDVALSTRAADATLTNGTQRSGVLDGNGNAISSTDDGAKRRLDVRAQAEGGDGAAAPGTAVLIGGNQGGNLAVPHVVTIAGRKRLATISTPREVEATLSGRMFSAFREGSYGATQTLILCLRNPAGSGRNLLVWAFNFNVTNAVAQEADFRVYHDCAVSANGTALTIQNRLSGAGAGVAAAYYGSTATGGTLVLVKKVTSIYTDTQPIPVAFTLVLAPGGNLRVTTQADGAGRACTAGVIYEEADI